MRAHRPCRRPARHQACPGGAHQPGRTLPERGARGDRRRARRLQPARLARPVDRGLMEITELEAIPFALPFREPYITASGRLDQREMILVRLHTDEGLIGLGEVTPLSLRGGTSLEKAWGQLRKAGHRLSRTSLDGIAGPDPLAAAIEVVVAQVPGRRYAAPVKAGLEMALFDLSAKVAGEPLWRLMKGAEAAPVRCNATLSSGEAADVAERASAWAARGFRTFKLKVGAGDDLAQVAAVRSAIGTDARIRVDANGSWTTQEAIESLDAI